MRDNIRQLFDLSGRVALCTGGSSGIGRRMALTLSQAGADVVLVGRNEASLAEAMQQIETESGGRARTVAADLLDRSVLGDVVAEASQAFGAPDILINAAGINLREPWDEITEASWDQTLDINLSTPFFLARHCIPGMKDKARGNIINVASLQSYRAFANSIAYGGCFQGRGCPVDPCHGRNLVAVRHCQ